MAQRVIKCLNMQHNTPDTERKPFLTTLITNSGVLIYRNEVISAAVHFLNEVRLWYHHHNRPEVEHRQTVLTADLTS